MPLFAIFAFKRNDTVGEMRLLTIFFAFALA